MSIFDPQAVSYNKEKITPKGTHILSVCDARSSRAKRLEQMCEDVRWRKEAFQILYAGKTPKILLRELWEEYNYYIEQLHRKYLANQFIVENITTTVGRAVFAQILGGDNTYTGNVNYTALGTNATAAAVGQTTLVTETYRKALSSGTDSSTTSYIETFFTAAETSGTYEEYGNFIDGTAGADTGQMFNRFTQSVTKAVTETLNVQSIITWADA